MSHLWTTRWQNRKKSTSASPDKNSQVPDGEVTYPSLLCLAGTELCHSLPPDCWLGIRPCPSVETELFHLKNTKKNSLEYCNCPSSHVNCLIINRKLLGGTGRAPVPALPPSLPFLLQIKPPPLISSTSFSGWLFIKLTLLTQRKAGSSALWLTTFFWQRKSTMNNRFWRLSKKQSKKVSAGLGNFLCTGSLIKAGDRKQ